MATHKADGLYYVSLGMLRRKNACDRQQRAFRSYYGQRIIVTFDNVLDARRKGMNVWWLVCEMYMSRRITDIEYSNFNMSTGYNASQLPSDSDLSCARALMDLLAARARREGRLP